MVATKQEKRPTLMMWRLYADGVCMWENLGQHY